MSLTDDDKRWIEGRLGRVQEELENKLERVETSLLTEFHKWASPVEMRQRSQAATLRTLEMELESLSDRVKKLEDRTESRS